jgi:general secretion pathway protein J
VKNGFRKNLKASGYDTSGFTLLELTISITLIGIIVVIILGALRLGLRSVESGERRIDALERIRSSMNIVDSQIQSQIPLTYVEDGETKNYFIGARDFMRFATNYSVWGGEKGYALVTYTITEEDDGRQALYISENTVGMEGSRETRLFNPSDQMFFEYFYKGPTDEVGEWVSEWTENAQIPKKVRLIFIEDAHEFFMIFSFKVLQLPSGIAEGDDRYLYE